MKLHEILGRILTDVALRQANPDKGVCELLAELSADLPQHEYDPLYRQFHDARSHFTQTGALVYPVLGPNGRSARSVDFHQARQTKTMWRGAYGVNRRKLVRDCWRWAKERNV